MLSLLLTVLGLIYVAYSAVQRDMQQLAAIHFETIETMTALEQQLFELREQVEKGGEPELFDQFIDRIESLQQQLNGLAQMQQTQSQTVENLTSQNIDSLAMNLEKQIEARLQGLLTQLATTPQESITPTRPATGAIIEMDLEPTIVEPTPPVQPRVEQRVVRLVEPRKPQDADVNWLLQQPAEAFVLQLASMPDRSGIEKVIRDKRVQGGRIIPQLRDGRQSYILVVGAYQGRAEANQKAIELKDSTGISPWIRRIRDLSSRVE